MAQILEPAPKFVVVSNLHPKASKTDVQRFINFEATTFNVGKLHKDESSLQSCEVELFNDRDLRDALALNGKIFMGYEVAVEKLEANENPFEVFVRKIPIRTSEWEIRSVFSQFGKIEELTLPRWHDTGKPRGFCFIRFAEKEHAKKAVQLDEKLRLHGARLSIRINCRFGTSNKHQKKPTAQRESKRMTQRPDKCTTIYVGNIDFDASEEQISELFSTCGTVLSVRIVRQQFTNRSRGFAYISFENEESVTRAVAMDKQEFLGRKIRVDYAEPFDPTRSMTKNFSTYAPGRSTANEAYLSEYLPTPSSFIQDHFADNPFGGIAALAGAGFITEQRVQQTLAHAHQPHLTSASTPFYSQMMPSAPNCSMMQPFLTIGQPNAPNAPMMPSIPMQVLPGTQYFPNFFVPHVTQAVCNPAPTPDSIQMDATLFTQGIPGLGQFLAPYGLLTQRAMPMGTSQAPMQAKPPAQAPIARTTQAKPKPQSFSAQDLTSANHTATTQAPPQQMYRIYSESIDGEPWEGHDVNNAVLL